MSTSDATGSLPTGSGQTDGGDSGSTRDLVLERVKAVAQRIVERVRQVTSNSSADGSNLPPDQNNSAGFDSR